MNRKIKTIVRRILILEYKIYHAKKSYEEYLHLEDKLAINMQILMNLIESLDYQVY